MACLAQLRNHSPGLHERLLRQVIRQCRIATATQHQCAHPRLASPQQFGKRVAVTLARQRDEQNFRALAEQLVLCRQSGSLDQGFLVTLRFRALHDPCRDQYAD